jgi:hypothetical protein
MLKVPLAVALAAAAVLALPSQAGAYIQIDQGIAGARIGNTQAQVRTALGDPALVKTGSNDFGPFTQYFYEGGLRVFFQGNDQVTAITTLGRGDRTAKGVGIGSTEKAVKANVKGVKCETFDSIRSCHTGSGSPGERITDFFLRKGRVYRVVVGIVID